MEIKRKPYQGVWNIVRFNWHFYIIAEFSLIILILGIDLFSEPFRGLIISGSLLAILTITVSLLISYYVYDLSDLYKLNWLGNIDNHKILTVNAGFDETSEIILQRFKKVDLTICDFYDPEKHTEVSIKRARKAYPPNPSTRQVKTNHLPFEANIFDRTLAILSAHEIRAHEERTEFFKELKRVTRPNGQIIVTEHLRDWSNFLAYNIGFLHFHSRDNWLKIFREADLTLSKEIKNTPFITTFILKKNGNTF